MRNTKIPGLALTLALALSASVSEAHDKDKKAAMPGGPSAELHKIMAGGMKDDMKMSGDVDRDFAAMMVMHHQQAIDMVDVELKSGTNPELKALAKRMKDAQKKEQEELRKHD